jgi:hypothetical protein
VKTKGRRTFAKTFFAAGINIAWDVKPSAFVPWQPPNSIAEITLIGEFSFFER